MNKLNKRKKTRTEREKANRQARFIEDYIKARHTDVYAQADKAYKDIQSNNKSKKDLRKTDEFIRLTTQYKNLRQYYERPNKTGTKQHTDNTATKQYTDNMVLNIQLMDEGTWQDPPPPQRLLIPDVAETKDPTPPALLPPIPDAMFQQLLDEIRNDPELDLIFNDMAFGGDNIPATQHESLSPVSDDIMDLSGINIDIELQTPLEVELSNIY